MTQVLTLGEARRARRFFRESMPVETIAKTLGKPLDLVKAATVDREAIAVTLYRATRDLRAVASAISARKGTVLEILARHGIEHAPAGRGGNYQRANSMVNAQRPEPRAPKWNARFDATPVPDEPAPKDALSFEATCGCLYAFGVSLPYKFCSKPVRKFERGGKIVDDVYCEEHRALCSQPPMTEVYVAARHTA